MLHIQGKYFNSFSLAKLCLTTFFSFLFFFVYSQVQDNDDWNNKAKGVKKVVAKTLQPDEYDACLLDREKHIYKDQCVFRSVLHQIYTENLHKVALNGNDEKRFICENGINTLAWGHYNISVQDDGIELDEMIENELAEIELDEMIESDLADIERLAGKSP